MSIVVLVSTAWSAIPVAAARAQDGFRRGAHEGFATRAELESLAVDAERAASRPGISPEARSAKQATVFMVRQRLREGDFQPGDRISLALDGAVKFRDTVVVRSGRTVALPDLPEISLAGVLRSELQTFLTHEIGRYIKDPEVETRPLMRLTVSGGVARPGFYSVAADALLSDVVMMAGGPSPRVDFAKSTIRRGAEELWSGQSVETALNDGMTIDALLLRSGDEVLIGEKRQTNWFNIAQGLAALGGVVSLLFAVVRR